MILETAKRYVCSGGPATKQKQPYIEQVTKTTFGQVSLDRYASWGNGK